MVSQLPHGPLQAVSQSIFNIATGLQKGVKSRSEAVDVFALSPDTVCRNAISILHETSPFLGRALLTVGPFCVLGFGLWKYVWKGLGMSEILDKVRSRFAGKITVPGDHLLNRSLIAWMASNGVGTDTRCLTLHKNHLAQASGEGSSLSFIPSVGSSWFCFNGKSFNFERGNAKQIQLYDESGKAIQNATTSREADITISYFSIFGNVEPIKEFLEHVQAISEVKGECQTHVYRLGKYINDGEYWDQPITRPSRNLDSVTMEDEDKIRLVQDVTTYLAEEKWYADRGIPYRRGYLFFGPPGTGKTSTCVALAGHFDLEIYIISLSNELLDDAHLESAFIELPARCIVLLEDVNSAGIQREAMISLKAGKKSKKAKNKVITLSGLLNVIDGPCSIEGRILCMTSNSPDSLDPALLRPGRIDYELLFGNASQEVTKKLFLHIFSGQPGAERSDSDLVRLSESFAAQIPADELTPAEIQNFLLMRRNDPDKSVAEAEEWAESEIEKKENGRNVTGFKGQCSEDADDGDSEPVSHIDESDEEDECTAAIRPRARRGCGRRYPYMSQSRYGPGRAQAREALKLVADRLLKAAARSGGPKVPQTYP